MNVLVTGANGFVGGSLCEELSCHSNICVLGFDVQHDPATLPDLLERADVVFHLAGVNRPIDPKEFETGNVGLTQQICKHLIARGRNPLLILSSSTMAELDNPYGQSKRRAEEVVRQYATTTGADVAIYRLANVFGKGCRPNYNSAVATFCHNLARDLTIKVNDHNTEMTLVYIDDVVDEFVRAIEGHPTRQGAFCMVPVVFKIKLGQIVELLCAFKHSLTDLQVPNQADGFAKKLYATYLSYLPADKFAYPLKMNVDARGSFTEFLKTPERGQISINVSKPGVTKGNHWHRTKTERFLVVSGRGVIRFRKLGESEVIVYPVSGEKMEVIVIPPGYAHSIENLGETDMATVMWASENFDPNRNDTYRLDV